MLHPVQGKWETEMGEGGSEIGLRAKLQAALLGSSVIWVDFKSSLCRELSQTSMLEQQVTCVTSIFCKKGNLFEKEPIFFTH